MPRENINMKILPISNLTCNRTKALILVGNNTNTQHPSDKLFLTKDIPYSYPIVFKGKNEDSIWARGIFEKYGIRAKIDGRDGLLTINEFREPNKNESFSDLGIDVNRLMKNVKIIKGNADFSGYEHLRLPNLKQVNKTICCKDSKNIDFPVLGKANSIYCTNAESIKFPKLAECYELRCTKTADTNFPALERADSIVYKFTKEKIEFPKLTEVENIYAGYTKGFALPVLTRINCIYCQDIEEINLPVLETAERICMRTNNVTFPALTKATLIECINANDVTFSVLTKATKIECINANNIKFPLLSDADKVICTNTENIEFPRLQK